jgi:hypothetical protein
VSVAVTCARLVLAVRRHDLVRVHDAMPGAVSPHSKETVTLALFQPLTAAGVCELLMLGAVLSTLTVTVLAASVLPALSTLQYFKACSPSVVKATLVPVCTAPVPTW